MAGQGTLKIDNLLNAVRFVRQLSAQDLRSVGELKNEIEGLFEDYFVQRLVSKHESLVKMGFDQEKAIQLTVEALENKLRTTLQEKSQ